MDNMPTAAPGQDDPIILEQFDAFNLTKALDRAKAEVLSGRWSSFFGPLMCAHNFVWDRGVPTACTNGSTLWINPYWFAFLPHETRITVLMHELKHPASLHMLRIGNRDPQVWNWACDIRINNDLRELGYSFKRTRPWMTDPSVHPAGMAEEDIYDDLMKRQVPMLTNNGMGPIGTDLDALDELKPEDVGGDTELLKAIKDALGNMLPDDGDVVPMDEDAIRDSVNAVVKADQQSKLTGGKGIGEMPGNTEYLLEQFLSPVVPWEKVLADFMRALSKRRSTWATPRRRIQHIYLPGRKTDRSGLEHLNYYWDVSGSISEKDEVRFNSEVRYIKDKFDPELLTLIEFDTQIQFEKTFTKTDKFEDIKIIGKGGTDLVCVHEHIERTKPTAAIIFTDLYCAPMKALKHKIPVLWVVVNNPKRQVPFGKIAYINS